LEDGTREIDALEPESSEIIGHAVGGVPIQTDSQERSHFCPKGTVGESIKEIDKQAECQKKTHRPWVSEFQAWLIATVMKYRYLQTIKSARKEECLGAFSLASRTKNRVRFTAIGNRQRTSRSCQRVTGLENRYR
jgi:hypothetical protein